MNAGNFVELAGAEKIFAVDAYGPSPPNVEKVQSPKLSGGASASSHWQYSGSPVHIDGDGAAAVTAGALPKLISFGGGIGGLVERFLPWFAE
ncbi:hypothetical protein [Mesorhizobium sp. 113-3-3]|uniref:hypothetical protein n=1 Tax=Mesorhizobium sp. 113-3-3 TaxID=2744516 RepID=UPI0018EC06A1|nr:hypothetical protein [Mesorhizobium sp. 113-3-3]